MEKSRFYTKLQSNLGKSSLSNLIQNLSYDESIKHLRGLNHITKNTKASELFASFCKDLDELNLLNKINVKKILEGIKSALIDEDENYLYKLIYEHEKMKKQISAQKSEIKNQIIQSFDEIEEYVINHEFNQKNEILSAINDVLLNELEMKGILKEASEAAFISAIENGSDVEDTAKEISKNMVFSAICEGDFVKSRFIDISDIVINQAVNVANESKIFSKELIKGAIDGSNEGILKAIEKFKDDLKFAPDEILQNLNNSAKELIKVEDEFVKLIKSISNSSQEPAKSVLSEILQTDYDSYFAKMKRISNETAEQIMLKIEELNLDETYKEFSKNASQKLDQIRQELTERSVKFRENFDLDEKIANFKKEIAELEKKATEKFNELKNNRKNKTAKEKGEEVGLRTYEAAKENLKEENKENLKDDLDK